MTERQRRSRAEFILEEPVLWLVTFYSVSFLAVSAYLDLRVWSGGVTLGPSRYISPLAVTFPAWLGMRSWAKRVLAGLPADAAA